MEKIEEKRATSLIGRRREVLENTLDHQLVDLKTQSQTMMKTAVIVGGIFFVGYLLFKSFASKKEETKTVELGGKKYSMMQESERENESGIVRMIKDYMAVFLMSLAKQKLMEFLSKQGIVSPSANNNTL